jgi:hypothetical protein
MPLGLIVSSLGRSMRRKRLSSLDILSSKRAPRDYYKGKNCKPTGFHTRKGTSSIHRFMMRRAVLGRPYLSLWLRFAAIGQFTYLFYEMVIIELVKSESCRIMYQPIGIAGLRTMLLVPFGELNL